MKLRLILFFLLTQIGCFLSIADVEHTIERGETIESIAKLYGVTPDDIIKANPNAKDMFYAGMVLKIVTTSPSSVTNNYNPQTNDESTIIMSSNQGKESDKNAEYNSDKISLKDSIDPIENEEESYFRKGKNFFGVQIGYLFLKENKSSGGSSSSYSSGFSMMYDLRFGRYLIDNLFVDMNAGFAFSSTSIKVQIPGFKSTEQDYEFYSIPLNFHIGYTIPFNSRSGVSLYTGPMISFPVGSKYKVDGKKEKAKIDLKTAFNWDFGLELNLANWILGGRYTIGMNSKKDNPSSPKGTWMVYLGCLF